VAASTDQQHGTVPNTRIGFLLKHAHERWLIAHRAALDPLGISGRQLAVMHAVARATSPSQQEAADQLGIDRTTMVALIDELEGLGLVAREVDAADRRRNVVALTTRGRQVLRDGLAASDAAEAHFLAPLTAAQQREWRASLGQLVEVNET
jgi:DNA-binding MarR family transcriptional regulator